MLEKHLYEYAVIRYLPRVEREEFINVGIILFSKKSKYIKALYYLDENKIQFFSTELDIDSIRDNLRTFEEICLGKALNTSISFLDIAERFRWLTAVRSSSIQTSRPHPGFSDNLDETLQRLFEELVL
ncbi:DUF3037 domain-containing protein [Bacteroides sp. 224]|uniref:DUF3037 domain-containing protein n=1 Tax=Bacteroides sp. 224 TaxID=2302936 RepID=UPI0013D12407|nr:DUF3037 domain-containing protein [Bacteroides sp. 224]NDV64363.1 DUF3037 domain-containing protein [Bacteroides sp. 224]